jgi:hypothetical protein
MHNIITIVSGLPRSGTSMMMRMLQAGGMEILTDNIRKADTDNPRGYFEFEKVKKIKADDSWLEDAKGKAVKMVSRLLYDLPAGMDYNIIFLERSMQEVLASQRIMLKRQGQTDGGVEDEKMGKLFEKHLSEVKKWLQDQQNMDSLYISYNDVLANPRRHAARINRFLDNQLNIANMVTVVDQSLYRNRNRADNRKITPKSISTGLKTLWDRLTGA